MNGCGENERGCLCLGSPLMMHCIGLYGPPWLNHVSGRRWKEIIGWVGSCFLLPSLYVYIEFDFPNRLLRCCVSADVSGLLRDWSPLTMTSCYFCQGLREVLFSSIKSFNCTGQDQFTQNHPIISLPSRYGQCLLLVSLIYSLHDNNDALIWANRTICVTMTSCVTETVCESLLIAAVCSP